MVYYFCTFDFGESTRPEHAHNPLRRQVITSCDDLSVRAVNDGSLNYRFIIKAALHHNALIVSNDNYRDLMLENADWKRRIEANLLQYSFVGDTS